VDEGIVERGEDTGNAENELACNTKDVSQKIWYTADMFLCDRTITGQRAEGDVLLGGGGGFLGLGRHVGWSWTGIVVGWNMGEEKK
jgi:hypothetical protein